MLSFFSVGYKTFIFIFRHPCGQFNSFQIYTTKR
jgi:hypothetical protein